MKLIETELKGVFIIENSEFYDERGGFIKIFNEELFGKYGINFHMKEIYYSISHKNVIRGMHFQLPPHDCAKLVYVTSGKIIDVVLDLRKEQSTYGKHISLELNANKNAIYIPEGLAHGFKSLEKNSTVVYNQSSCYSKEHDSGILWNSFGFEWNVGEPIISKRDLSFMMFNNFKSEFK